jgi:N-methylhydantoinase A
MAHVVRRVTTERGLEASRFALVAYGGAGPLHAAEVARDLGIATVIIPHAPGHFSAYGMLAADLRKDFVQTSFMPLEQTTLADLDTRYAAMEDEGRRALAGNPHIREFAVSRAADMRYVGQEHAVTVDLPVALFAGEGTLGIKRQFDDVHSLRYGYAAPDEKAEIVSLRTSAIGIMPKPPHAPLEPSDPEPAPDALRTRRPIVFRRHGAPAVSPVYTRAALRPGNVIHGPAVVEEYASTTVVHPGDRLTVDRMGNLVIEIGKAR